MDNFRKVAIEQLEGVEAKLRAADIPNSAVAYREFIVSCLAAIERISGKGSIYSRQADAVQARNRANSIEYVAKALLSVLRALKSDVEAGYLSSFAELIHADLFAEYIDMAAHLLDQKYKDAAAVIAGSTLENHLRQLCLKSNVSLVEAAPNGDERSRKADRLNQELVKASVYNQLRAKQIGSWLDLRNKAAHGEYIEYTKEQVQQMIYGIQDFMINFPA